MDKRMKQNFMLVAAGVILYAAVMHLNYVMIFLKDIAGLFLPIFLGLTIAFVLSVPMNGFAKIIDKLSVKMSEKIFKKRGFKLKEKTVNAIDALFDENNSDNIVLYNEKEEPVEFEQVAIIPLDEVVYAILKPTAKIDGVKDDEAFAFEIIASDNDESLRLVEDEKIIDKVYDYFSKAISLKSF